jgi:ubiquinone/menaquinone biosynthesis C-methylase UbiE
MSSTEEVQAEQFKEQVRQNWTENAAAWRKWYPLYRTLARPATETIIEAAQTGPGMQVLDIASGTGEPALTLAEIVGSEGHVTATDLVPEMLAGAEENARQRGLTNLSFQQADAEALPFPPARFDAVTCSFGLMFCPNPGQALSEIRRVLKPGCRAAFLVWGPIEENPQFAGTMSVFQKYSSAPPPPPGAPTPFSFSKLGTLSAALNAAGFTQVQEEARAIPWVFPGSLETFWEFMSGMGGFQRFINAIPPDQRETATREALGNLRRYEEGHQMNLPAVIVVGSGVS